MESTAWYVAPLSKLYVTPVDGLVTNILPVATLHVGCVKTSVGTEGVTGCGFIVADTAVEVQPPTLFLTITS